MSDESTDQPERTGPEGTPEATDGATTPTAATAVSTLDAPPPAPEPDPSATAATAETESTADATPPAPRRRSVQVPVWLLVVVLAVIVVAGAFFLGRATADTSGDDGPDTLAEAAEMTARGDMELGDFDLPTLLDALRNNEGLDLGAILDLLEDQGRR